MKVICKQSFSTVAQLGWTWVYFKENLSYNCDQSATNYPYYRIYIETEFYINYIEIAYSEFKNYFYTEKEYRKLKLNKIYDKTSNTL